MLTAPGPIGYNAEEHLANMTIRLNSRGDLSPLYKGRGAGRHVDDQQQGREVKFRRRLKGFNHPEARIDDSSRQLLLTADGTRRLLISCNGHTLYVLDI